MYERCDIKIRKIASAAQGDYGFSIDLSYINTEIRKQETIK